jgi:hypothetical protein
MSDTYCVGRIIFTGSASRPVSFYRSSATLVQDTFYIPYGCCPFGNQYNTTRLLGEKYWLATRLISSRVTLR